MDYIGDSKASTARVIGKLVSMLTEEPRFLRRTEISEVESLKDELEIVVVLIKDEEARSVEEDLSYSMKHWLKQAKEAAEMIEDVVDEYVLKASQPGPHRSFLSFLGRASPLIGTSSNGKSKLFSDIQNIKTSLCEIKERGQTSRNVMTRIHSDLHPTLSSDGATISDRYRTYLQTVNPRLLKNTVGINSVAYELIDWLEEGESSRLVISLEGVSGIGKTTLARKVYDHVVQSHRFDCHAWITLTQSHKIEEVLRIVLQRIGEEPFPHLGMEELIFDLSIHLQSKRYLLVFDSVWQLEFLEQVKHAFPDNNKGSRIIITTRHDTVAALCKGSSFDRVHRLEPLTETMSWDLFCMIAFQHGGRCPPELEELSLEFLRMCRGLPLAIAAVAGVLSTKEETRSEWQRIHDDFKDEIGFDSDLEGISRVLVLGVHDLPYQLKMCFLYFSIFPEDYVIPNEKLFKLWIAEGFVQASGLKTSEEIAEEYLNELIQRNLVQACDGFYALEKFCRVHDSMREIVRQEAHKIGFCQIRNDKSSSFRGKSRRLSISDNIEENVLETIKDCEFRSVFLYNIGALNNSSVVTLFVKYRLLTLLDFENAPLHHIPVEVGNLFHLKYLCLKNTKVKKLPKSVGKLRNLQTLDVRNTLLVELPIEINKLKNLQHLLASRSDSNITLNSTHGVKIKEGIGYLENLQTLMTVESRLFSIGLENELKKLTGLRKLGISRLTATAVSSLCPSIEKMNHLEYLSLHLATNYEILDLETISSPPLFLQRLVLKGRLQRLPNWISSLQLLSVLCLSLSRLTDDPLRHLCLLPHLESLWLYRAYEGEEIHFMVGGFQKLKLLVLRDLQGLEVVDIEEGALPLVEELRIGPSPRLNEVPSGIPHLRSLKVLAFYDMPNEFVRNMQPEGGSDYVKVEHVRSLHFWYRVHGRNYASYELGEPDLLNRLQSSATNNIDDVARQDLRLSFCYSDEEANSASASTSNVPRAHDRTSFSSDQFNFFSDDIED